MRTAGVFVLAAFLVAIGAWLFMPFGGEDTGEAFDSTQRRASPVGARPVLPSDAGDDPRNRSGLERPGDGRLDAEIDAVVAFEEWVSSYVLAADDAARVDLVAEGVKLAAARRDALGELIAADPQLALEAALPWPERAELPAAVTALLEERVDGLGQFKAVVARPPEGESTEGHRTVYREAVVNGRSYETYVYGRRAELMTSRAIALHGIAVDGRLALLDSPVRLLEPGEFIPAGKRVDELCLISGEAAGPDAREPGKPVIAADLGDRIVYLCHAGHIALLENGMLAQEGGATTVAAPTPAAASEYTTGTKNILFIRVRFADQDAAFTPQSDASSQAMFSEAAAFFDENAYGALAIVPTVTPVYRLPESAAWYKENDSSGYGLNVLQAARIVAASPEQFFGNEGLPAFDYTGFDFEVVRYSGGPGGFSGQAYVGYRGCWLKTDNAGVLAHELGHNLGLWHANAWSPASPATVVGPGSNLEYGDSFDTMGPAKGGPYHFNAYEKHRLTWLPTEAVATVTSNGVHVVHAHDIAASPDPAKKYALFLPRDADRDYWFEYRRHSAWEMNPWLRSGLGVRWDPWQSANGGSQLLDVTPYSSGGRTDAAIRIGRTFSDPVADIHVTPLGFANDDESALEVDVQVGPFPDNRPPEAALSAPANPIGVGQPALLSVDASDADGDALAYFWDLGDESIAENAAAVSKIWGQAGDYRVRVVVSDRKGGTTSAATVVRVGEPKGTTLTGRVTDIAGEPVPGAHVDNGRNPIDPAYRGAWTDSEGSFALTGLSAGSWTLRATRPGWIITPLAFANPVDTPGTGGPVDFVARFNGFEISGVVRHADGAPVAHALVSDGTSTEPTDENGVYRFAGHKPGKYTVTATKGESVFSSEAVRVAFDDVVAPAIHEVAHTISGSITGATTGPITVTDGWRSTTVHPSDENPGAAVSYSLAGVPAGKWHLRAVQAGAGFSPDGWTNPLVVNADAAGIDFVRNASGTYAISGRVTDLGEGVAGAVVTTSEVSTVTDSRGGYWLAGLEPGSHLVTAGAAGLAFAPVARAVAITNGDVNAQDFASTRINQPPVILAAAYAIPPFDREAIALAIEADDDADTAFLRYQWSVVGSAPGEVSFSDNGTHGAVQTVATFSQAGDYDLRATVTDAHGASVSSDVTVSVLPTPMAIAIEPASALVRLGSTYDFTLTGTDQFGATMAITSGLEWGVSGGGSIDSSGRLHATVAGEDFEVTARMGAMSARASFAVGYTPGPGSGLTREVWNQVPGDSIADLASWHSFPDSPDMISVLHGPLELSTASDGPHGRRLRGYFMPPATGDYVFHLAAADAGELRLSPGVAPAEAQTIARVEEATAVREWTKFPSQQSAAIPLVEGEPVYLEVLHKDTSAEGHLSVGMQAPGGVFERPIPAHRLLPWGSAVFPAPEITAPAQATPDRIDPGESSTLTVSASSPAGENSLRYQWSVVGSAPGSVAFSANGSNAARSATAQFDAVGRYRLRVVVTDNAGQSVQSETTVVVTESMESWRARYFSAAELDDAALEDSRWGEEADPDGDGLNNLLEYAFGLDPLTFGRDGAPRPTVVTVDGVDYLAVTFRRNVTATGLTYTPVATSDLRNWESGLLPVGDVDGEIVTYRDVVPLQSTRRRFVRVQVTTP